MSNFYIINISYHKPFQRFSPKKIPHIAVYTLWGISWAVQNKLHIIYLVTLMIDFVPFSGEK